MKPVYQNWISRSPTLSCVTLNMAFNISYALVLCHSWWWYFSWLPGIPGELCSKFYIGMAKQIKQLLRGFSQMRISALLSYRFCVSLNYFEKNRNKNTAWIILFWMNLLFVYSLINHHLNWYSKLIFNFSWFIHLRCIHLAMWVTHYKNYQKET